MITNFISNNSAYLQAFSTIFISILLEAFPFIMMGVIISSIINVVISEELIQRLMPKNIVLGSIVGALMGFLFPVCDCAVIPVARRLMKKGVPVHTGTAFMLAAPIINPVVLIATAYAFKDRIPDMIYYRSIFGLIISITVGIILGVMIDKKDTLKSENTHEHHEEEVCCAHEHVNHEEEVCGCGHDHSHDEEENSCGCGHELGHKKTGFWSNIESIIRHSSEEFFSVGKYLIIGASIAAAVQAFFPREILSSIGQNTVLSIVVMMAFAYFLALCSTSDSFIAKTFIGQFTNSSILAFLLVGPMIDIKNTIVMHGNFKPKYIVRLIALVFFLCYTATLIAKSYLFF